jgi:homoaconitase/3-isopropylmalate dehydratase large subunit
LSFRELEAWVADLEGALAVADRRTVAVETVLSAAPTVLEDAAARGVAKRLADLGATLTPACFEAFMSNPHLRGEHVVTTSNKLRAYTGARWVSRSELARIAAGGSAAVGGRGQCL